MFLPGYLPGALVLGQRLWRQRDRLHGAKRVLLVDKGSFSHSQLELLASVWEELVDVNLALESSREAENWGFGSWRDGHLHALVKVELWALEYEKVLYLDCDTLPRDLPGGGLVGDLLAVEVALGAVAAAPDAGCPDTFNSGVMVLRPGKETYEELKEAAKEGFSYDGADQGLFNMVFNSDPDWPGLAEWTFSQPEIKAQKPGRWVPVPYLYNTAAEVAGPALGFYSLAADRHFKPLVKCVHFIGPRKPWHGGLGRYTDEWWAAWRDLAGGMSVEEFTRGNVAVVKQLSVPGVGGGAMEEDKTVYIPLEKLFSVELECAPPMAKVPSEHLEYLPLQDENPLFVADVPVVESGGLTPADLCDPLKYIAAFGPTVEDASWDATREAPPMEEPKQEQFVDEMKAYRSHWEEPERHEPVESILPEVVQPPEEPKVDEFQEVVPKAPLDPVEFEEPEVPIESPPVLDNLSIFHTQVAERVFDDRSNYTPQHNLLLREKKEKALELPKVPISPKILGPQVLEAEESLDSEEEAAEEVPITSEASKKDVEDLVEDLQEEPKKPQVMLDPIFPWELRPSKAAERTFRY